MMRTERLNPLNDFLFQKTFGEAGNEEQLLGLLNAILSECGRQYSAVTIRENTRLTAEIVSDKTSILDVRAILEGQTKANVEVQLRKNLNMDRRVLQYWSREYSSGIGAGEDYIGLPGVIAVNIVGYEHDDDDLVHSSYHLWKDQRKDRLLTDSMEIHFIDMVKFRRKRGADMKNEALRRWLQYFDENSSDEELMEVLEMDAAIRKAYEAAERVSMDKEQLRLYHMREMAILDYNSNMNAFRREGKAEGLAEGRAEGLTEGIARGEAQAIIAVAKKLLEQGVPFQQIVNSTGLSEDEIRTLQ